MHEENKRSLRYSYRAHRISKHSYLNATIGHDSKIARTCGGGGGGITAASSGTIGDKEAEDNDFFHEGEDIGNDISE